MEKDIDHTSMTYVLPEDRMDDIKLSLKMLEKELELTVMELGCLIGKI